MIHIVDKEKCCGCTACASICPQKCITMKPDFEGFVYPMVDENGCINCKLCEKTCPVINAGVEEHSLSSYVLRTKDVAVLEGSTSGEFITPLAGWVNSQDGVICGAVYDKHFNVVHKILRGILLTSRFQICTE